MKYLVALAVALQGAAAFPSAFVDLESRAAKGCKTSALCEKKLDISDADIGYNPKKFTPAQVLSKARPQCGGAQGPCITFSEDQLVSTTGQWAYHSPLAGQIRGPCPGLNAAANHGYLPRSGVASIPRTITGLFQSYGLSPELSGFLAAYAVVFDGDLITQSWSIGGPQPASTLGKGILGTPQGISYSHNKYEGDTSIGRCDAYVNGGDAHSLSMQRFRYAYETGMDNDRYTFDKFSQLFAKNTIRSIKHNPMYFAPLFSTTLVSPAAHNFVVTFMSNRTKEDPNGYLNGEMFKQFFAVEGKYPDFKWKPGQERIPDNWYKRPNSNLYNAVQGVFGDLAFEFAAYPKSFRFGGNTKGTDSYVGIDISNVTGGVFSADTLFQGNNLACFFYRTEQQALPDALRGGINAETAALKLLTKVLGNTFGNLACPKLSKYDTNSLKKYPGHKYSPKAPKGKTPTTC